MSLCLQAISPQATEQRSTRADEYHCDHQPPDKGRAARVLHCKDRQGHAGETITAEGDRLVPVPGAASLYLLDPAGFTKPPQFPRR